MIKNDTFILGKKVALRALSESDVESTNWYGWFNDKETTAHMQKHYFPNTVQDQLRFLKSISGDKSKLQLGIVDIESDMLVGIVSLNNINHINRNAELYLLPWKRDEKGRLYLYSRRPAGYRRRHRRANQRQRFRAGTTVPAGQGRWPGTFSLSGG